MEDVSSSASDHWCGGVETEVVRLSVVGIADRHAVLRTTYEASSSDGGDDAFVQRVQGVLGGDGWCAGESAWYTEEALASSAASAEGIGARVMRRAALRCSGRRMRRR